MRNILFYFTFITKRLQTSIIAKEVLTICPKQKVLFPVQISHILQLGTDSVSNQYKFSGGSTTSRISNISDVEEAVSSTRYNVKCGATYVDTSG